MCMLRELDNVPFEDIITVLWERGVDVSRNGNNARSHRRPSSHIIARLRQSSGGTVDRPKKVQTSSQPASSVLRILVEVSFVDVQIYCVQVV